MDFDDTAEEAAFRDEARQWLSAHAPAKGSADDFSTGYLEGTLGERDHVRLSKQWQRALYQAGWAGITWPRAVGGRGGTAIQSVIFNLEQARFGVSSGAFAVGIGMAGPTILQHGTDAQKERFLGALLRGDELWCQLFSEPGAGSDLANVATRAERDGDEWVVTGQKVWTSSADHSDWGILLARTDPDVPKHRGITYFLVDMTSPGFDVRPLRQMTGSSHFSEVFIDGVRVPHANVLGDVHGGWSVAITTLSNERGLIAGANRSSDAAALMALARTRGRDDDGVLRQALVDCWSRQQVQRFLGYRAQTALSQRRQPGSETSIMKLFAAEYLRRLGNTALGVLGPEGTLSGGGGADGDGDGGEWQARFLHAPAIRIAGGSNEVQRNVIAERVLGLLGEVRADRNVAFRPLNSPSQSDERRRRPSPSA